VQRFLDKETEREIHLLAICFVSSFYFAAQQELQKKSIFVRGEVRKVVTRSACAFRGSEETPKKSHPQ
jgi:hypothetical protein